MSSGVRVTGAAAVARGRPGANDLVLSGAVIGLLAGAAMLAWATAAAMMADLPGWHALEQVAATFTRGEPVEGPGALVSAGLLWAIVSVALALPYATIVPRDFPFASAALVGTAYAFVVMAVVTTVVLPRLNPPMRAAMSETGGAWVLAYAVFGITLAFIPVMRRRVLGR